MTDSARAVRLLILAWALSACSGPAETGTPAPQEPAPPPAAQPVGAVDSPADLAGVSPLPPAAAPGLPDVSRGPRVRLRSPIRSGVRRVEGRRVPTVRLPDEGARVALDAQLERLTGRLQVEFALPRVVSVRRTPPEEQGGPPQGELFFIDGSTVTHVDMMSIFLEGAERLPLQRRLQYDPAASAAPMVATEGGIEVRFDRHHIARFPWRSVAPLLRPDTALGEALTAQGLTLPAAGTRFPDAPPVTVGIWDDSPGALLARWRTLPPHLRALARLADTGGPRASALVFPPGVTRVGAPTRPAFYVQPLADLTLARATDSLQIGDPANARLVRRTRPAGTLVTAVRGPVLGTDSDVGVRQKTFVRSGDVAGWARAAPLALLGEADCGELSPPDGDRTVHEQGTIDDGDARYVWFLSSGTEQPPQQRFTLHPLAACTVGAALHQLPIAHQADIIHVFRSAVSGGRLLVAVLDRAQPSLESTLVIVEPGRATPVMEHRGRVLEVQVAVRVGPDLERGYYPLRVLSGAAQTWYRWEGDAFSAVEAPAVEAPVVQPAAPSPQAEPDPDPDAEPDPEADSQGEDE